eukprot:TRINITY_DN60545_c0_g1_i1.p2 TRINITY_DN60545_c0_g1~~TRINITY_DN60545_c0_g1_i1.p2  ORF type:complete len:114 (+),score=27.80 TRINITY_DN60545_c0_g1_i1:31-372(+)
MIGGRPRSTLSSSSAASDVYKRQLQAALIQREVSSHPPPQGGHLRIGDLPQSVPTGATSQFAQLPTSYLRTIFIDNSKERVGKLSLIHISEPTRLLSISYAVFCLKKKKRTCT